MREGANPRRIRRGRRVHEKTIDILWQEPFSFLMRRELLQLDAVRTRPVMRARNDEIRTLVDSIMSQVWLSMNA